MSTTFILSYYLRLNISGYPLDSTSIDSFLHQGGRGNLIIPEYLVARSG